jgi:hypothetical protein
MHPFEPLPWTVAVPRMCYSNGTPAAESFCS